MCRAIIPLLIALLLTGQAFGRAGISDMARTSEFWVVEPFGLSRHLDYPMEAELFRGRFVKDNDWLTPERFVHDEAIVRGVKGIARVENIAIVGDTFGGDYFAVFLPKQEVHTHLSHGELATLLGKWGIEEPRFLSFDEAETAFTWHRTWLWVGSGSFVVTVGMVALMLRLRRRRATAARGR